MNANIISQIIKRFIKKCSSPSISIVENDGLIEIRNLYGQELLLEITAENILSLLDREIRQLAKDNSIDNTINMLHFVCRIDNEDYEIKYFKNTDIESFSIGIHLVVKDNYNGYFELYSKDLMYIGLNKENTRFYTLEDSNKDTDLILEWKEAPSYIAEKFSFDSSYNNVFLDYSNRVGLFQRRIN
jgi:hypothetical protein